MKITVLDAATLGEDLTLNMFDKFGDVKVYDKTMPDEVGERISNSDVVILNKVKLNRSNLYDAKNLKLICVAATGYDNIDVNYCKSRNIAVCNVKGYSSHSVAQVTVSMVLNLINHLVEYNRCVENGSYTQSGVQNCLVPVYHEIQGKTWGIIGLGGIGKQVAKVAQALGCNILAYKRNPEVEFNCVTLKELVSNSDIISIHLPLSNETNNLLSRDILSLAKKDAIIINVARGAIWDEEAVADAILENKIGAIGCDVYSLEPMSDNHPFTKICNKDNVCLTPHMAWGSYEARVRCMNEIVLNIDNFFEGNIRNRVDL